MAINNFEGSRVATGTLQPGGQKLTDTATGIPEESNAISRDDVRDGFSEGRREANSRRVLAASTLTGDAVRNPAGESLGRIEEIMLDVTTGRIAYAVLSFGGFLGIGDKLFAVPWNSLKLDRGEHEFILDVDRQTLENAPGFDKDNWPDMADTTFAETVHGHYGESLYWEHEVTEAGDYVGDNLQRNRSIEYEPSTTYQKGKR